MKQNVELAGQSVNRGFHYGWAILLTGILVVGGALGLARFGYGMILPSMQQGLGLTHDQTGFIASANMFGYFISALGAGLLASRFGPRVVVVIGLLWVGATMIATGLMNGVQTTALVRFLTGVGSAGANVAIMGLAAAWFAAGRRGMAMGFLVGGSGLGIAITGWMVPVVNGVYLEAGWRYNWFLLGALVIAFAVLAALVLRNTPAEKNLVPIGDTTGTLPAGPGNEEGSPGMRDILKIKGVFFLSALYFCFGFSYIITATYLVTFLVEELGCSQELAGQIWSTAGMLGIGSGLVWGMLSDRLGRRSMLVTVFLIQAGCYLLLQAGFTEGALLWLPAILFGLTAPGSIPGLAASCCGDLSDARRAPALLGFITLVFGLGQVLGPAAAGYIKEFTGSFAWAFALAASMAVSGALFSSRLVVPDWRSRKVVG